MQGRSGALTQRCLRRLRQSPTRLGQSACSALMPEYPSDALCGSVSGIEGPRVGLYWGGHYVALEGI
jgi:hypothetical protein